MKIKITTRAVDALTVKAKVYEVYDDILTGFLVRVLPSGLKSFWIRYRLLNGKRDRMVIGHHRVISVAQARDEARKLLGAVSMGNNPKLSKQQNSSKIPTFKEFIEGEYKLWSEAHLQWSHDNLQRLRRLREFSDLPLNEINIQIVDKWRSNCLKNKLTPASVNRRTASLRAVLSKAVDWGVIDQHPLGRFKQLKVDRSPKVRYLTELEEKRLRIALESRENKIREGRRQGNIWRSERGYELYPELSDVPFADHLKPLILLSLNTGARRGELFRLQWDDVDFDRKSIVLVMRGKRKSYTRHIPLNDEAYEVLLTWQRMGKDNKMVFPSKKGDKLDNIQTSWENLRKEAKINNFRWHDMRHHFASRLVMNGVPLNTVRELLGHTNVEMTLRYAHLAPEQKERAVSTLVRAL